MFLEEGAQAINSIAATSQSPVFKLSDAEKEHITHAVVWALFNRTKGMSLKFSIFKLPVSIKIEKLRPLIIHWVGDEGTFYSKA